MVPGAALPAWPPPTNPTDPAAGPGQEYLPRRYAAEPGGPAEPVQAPAPYGDWARPERPYGTVYGNRGGQPGTTGEADAPGQDQPGQHLTAWAPTGTDGYPFGADEASGSLTGHILAQGRPDTPAFESRGRTLVVFVLFGVGTVVVAGLVLAVLYLSGVL